ncbi:MAG: Trp biosynthesis-associated membrane protein, partial [Nocardioidaceae bacterium]
MTEPGQGSTQGGARDRRTFWPTVALGLAAAGLAAVGAGRVWVRATAVVGGVTSHAEAKGTEAAPLALALALVALASWGAVLVSRGWWRRVVAAIGAVAAGGGAIAALARPHPAQNHPLAGLAGKGVKATLDSTAWYPVTVIAAVVAALTLVVAVLRARRWPEMSARYDAAPAKTASEPDGAVPMPDD